MASVMKAARTRKAAPPYQVIASTAAASTTADITLSWRLLIRAASRTAGDGIARDKSAKSTLARAELAQALP